MAYKELLTKNNITIPNQIDKEKVNSIIDGFRECIDIVNYEPRVIAEPIRHGQWEKSKGDNDRWRCSHCGYTYIGFNGADTTFAEMCNYCPNCGAKMNGVKNNGEMDKT